MFTGIVEEVGRIEGIKRRGASMVLEVACRRVLEDVRIGDSIAVNGVCLTVISFSDSTFSADVMPETMNRTNLGELQIGSPVNLERALAAGDRFGGHFVQGHVDGTGMIESLTPDENAVRFRIGVPEELTRWMVEKGSVAINGISLTLVEVGERHLTVSVIPHTLEATQLKEAQVGDRVNIECDMIAKYTAKLLSRERNGLALKQ
ncbi:MAG: riboflavin synthase [Planifilum sp.]